MMNGVDSMMAHGDGIAGLLSLPEHSVDALITDPPYGVTECEWDRAPGWEAFWKAVHHAVKPDGAVCVFTQLPACIDLAVSNRKELRYGWTWIKNISTGFLNARRMPLKTHEDIYVFYRRLPTYNPQWWWSEPRHATCGNVWNSPVYGGFRRRRAWRSEDGRRYPVDTLSFDVVSGRHGKREHPTQKPVPLVEYLIRTYTSPGQLVADPFAGSGTTAVAAAQSGRRFACWELDPKWAAVAMERADAAVMRGAQVRMVDMMEAGDGC